MKKTRHTRHSVTTLSKPVTTRHAPETRMNRGFRLSPMTTVTGVTGFPETFWKSQKSQKIALNLNKS